MTGLSVRCTGQDETGRWIIGRPVRVADLRTYTKKLFDDGWVRASIEDYPKHVVAWIAPDREGGPRTWGIE
jgi:hypothetical protein